MRLNVSSEMNVYVSNFAIKYQIAQLVRTALYYVSDNRYIPSPECSTLDGVGSVYTG